MKPTLLLFVALLFVGALAQAAPLPAPQNPERPELRAFIEGGLLELVNSQCQLQLNAATGELAGLARVQSI